MDNPLVPDDEHYARYCGLTKRRDDGRPKHTAFCWREGETYLSGNWTEHYGSDIEQALIHIRECPCAPTPGPNGRYFVVPVKKLKKAMEELERDTPVVEKIPCDDNPSHAGLREYDHNDLLVRTHLANAVTTQEVYDGVASSE